MSKIKVALITGITGQDGSYLAEFLLDKGYVVHGIKRRSSSINTDRIDHLYQDPHVKNRKFILHYGDLADSMNLVRIVQEVKPDEIYNGIETLLNGPYLELFARNTRKGWDTWGNQTQKFGEYNE